MPLELTSFPQVPPSRTALTTAEIVQYITGPAASNFQLIEALLESVEATINTLPTTVRAGSQPDSANLYDRWIDTSENEQEKVCINAYTSGNGDPSDFVSMRDAATLTLATSAAAAAASATLTRASEFPTAYTENWIYVDSDTGATYVCIETYTAALPSGERESKFQSVLDATTSAAVASAQAAINNFADDNIVTANEKILVQREWEQIQDNYSLATSLATSLGQTGSSQYIALTAAYNALNTYLNTTLTIFGDLTSDSSLTGLGTTRAAWKTNWKAYYSAMRTYQDFISTTLDTDIDNVQTDETITQAEKREAYTRWQYEVRNYTNHDATTTALNTAGLIVKATDPDWQAYVSAYNALNTYLNTTLDLFNNATWPLALSSKSSNAAEWTAKWQALTDAERDVSQLVSTNQITAIDSLGDDNLIAKGGEKNLAISAWNTIYGTGGTGGEYDLLNQRTQALIDAGNTTLTTLQTNHTADYTALKAYLDGLTDFYNASVDTIVVNSEWDSAWTDYYKTHATLDSTVAQIYDTQIGLVTNIVDDGTIAVGAEKQALVELMGRLATEKAKMVTRATIGVGASTTAYVAAYDDLYSYITTTVYASLATFQDTTTVATGINRTTFRNKFDAYYTAREDLETAIISNNFNNLSIDSAAIPNMATDGQITSEEKYVVLTYWTAIYGTADDAEHASLIQQATDFSVSSTYSDAFDDAFQRLFNFLFNNDQGAPLSVATPLGSTEGPGSLFTNMGNVKTMDASQQSYWQTYWSAYYTTRDTLVAQIQAALNTELGSKIDSDGSVAMAASLNMGGNTVSNMAEASAETEALRKSQLTTHEADTSTHGVTTVAGLTEVQTFTNKTLTTPVIASLLQAPGKTVTTAVPSGASDTMVLLALAQTLTNKTIGAGCTVDADTATVSNIEVDNLKAGTAVTSVRTIAGGASDSNLATEQGIREALDTVEAAAVAAAVAAAGSDYGVYVSEVQTDTAKTVWTSSPIGTRLNVTDPDYLASSFNFQFKSLSQDIGEDGTNDNGYRRLYLNGTIKKTSGSANPTVILEWYEHEQSEFGQGSAGGSMLGALADNTSLSDARAGDSYISNLEFKRNDISNELCYELILTTNSRTNCDFRMWMTGPRAYAGTLITSSNGTEF